MDVKDNAKTKLTNVVFLGLAFHLIFFAFQTSVFIQQTVISSLQVRCSQQFNQTMSTNLTTTAPVPNKINNDPDSKHSNDDDCKFNANAYIGLCITYAVLALSNWIAPSVLALTGVELGMLLSALTYLFYVASFLAPSNILFYVSATIIGVGAACLWTAQGSYLAKNSNETNVTRNASIFWSLLQSSMLLGNIFVYFAFTNKQEHKTPSQDKNTNNKTELISDQTRIVMYSALSLVCLLGIFVLLIIFIRSKRQRNIQSRKREENIYINENVNKGAAEQFIAAVKLAKTSEMLILSFTFLFTGQLLTFFTGILGTVIGSTPEFGSSAKQYIGIAGIFIGLGEIVAGFMFGVGASILGLGDKLKVLPKRYIISLGFILLSIAFAIVFVSFPPDSTTGSMAMISPFIESSICLTLIASFLIGFGDACFNTQIYVLLMSFYHDDSIGAFALFKFVQSAGTAASFFYSTYLDLTQQLEILVGFAFLGTICFAYVEHKPSTHHLNNL